jgi:hypothetical protein
MRWAIQIFPGIKFLETSRLSKITLSPLSRREHGERILRFAGEPFDKLKALSKVEGIPPKKRVSISEDKVHDRYHSHQTDRS